MWRSPVAEVVMPARETELLSTEGMSSRGKGSPSGRAGRGAGAGAACDAPAAHEVLCGVGRRGEARARALGLALLCGVCWAVYAVWRGAGSGAGAGAGAGAVRCAVGVVVVA